MTKSMKKAKTVKKGSTVKKIKPKKLLITFGQKGVWFRGKLEQKIKHYNVERVDDFDTNTWWNGISEFFKQKSKLSSALRNVGEIVILSEYLSGFYAGFILEVILLAKSKDKKVSLITSSNCLNEENFESYLSEKARIHNVFDNTKYKDNFQANISVFGLESCLNTLYIQETEKCLAD